MTGKQYASIFEILRDAHPQFVTLWAESCTDHPDQEIVKSLAILRTVRRLSQLAIATKTHMVLTEVSELENGTDADARLGDLQAYANAVGCDLEVRLVPREEKEEAADA